MNHRYVTLALTSVIVSTLLSGCGLSIHAVEHTTPVASSTASGAVVQTATIQATIDPSPTTSATVPSPATAVPPATTTAAPTVEATTTTAIPPTALPTTPVQRPTSQSQLPVPAPTTAPPTPTPSPTPEPTAPACADMPVRGFGLLWSTDPAVAQAIGCPVAPETGLSARVQSYQNGFMIWLDTLTPGIDQAPWVVTLIGDSAARYRVPSADLNWDEGASEPSGAFKWIWDNVYTVQQSIGSALDPWYATDAAFQRFDHGTMLWLRNPPDGDKPMIYVVNDDLLNASDTTFQAYLDQGAQ